MKNLKIALVSLSLLMTGGALISCGGNGATGGGSHENGKEFTSAYICPMHCENSGSETMGTCPACGMDYVERSEHMKDGHTH